MWMLKPYSPRTATRLATMRVAGLSQPGRVSNRRGEKSRLRGRLIAWPVRRAWLRFRTCLGCYRSRHPLYHDGDLLGGAARPRPGITRFGRASPTTRRGRGLSSLADLETFAGRSGAVPHGVIGPAHEPFTADPTRKRLTVDVDGREGQFGDRAGDVRRV